MDPRQWRALRWVIAGSWTTRCGVVLVPGEARA
jgi:hypothetical protein